jgi:hypothetical protein
MTVLDPIRSVEDLRAILEQGLSAATPAPKNEREPELPLMDPNERPQDPWLDGRDMRFEGYKLKTLEQGGEYPDTMPQAIEVTDAEGREALYVPLSKDGKVVRSAGVLNLLKRSASSDRSSKPRRR